MIPCIFWFTIPQNKSNIEIYTEADEKIFAEIVDEFLDFYLQLAEVKDFFDACPDYVLGKTMDSDVRGIFIPRPDESEYT